MKVNEVKRFEKDKDKKLDESHFALQHFEFELRILNFRSLFLSYFLNHFQFMSFSNLSLLLNSLALHDLGHLNRQHFNHFFANIQLSLPVLRQRLSTLLLLLKNKCLRSLIASQCHLVIFNVFLFARKRQLCVFRSSRQFHIQECLHIV